MCASICCLNSSGEVCGSSPLQVFTDWFIARKGSVKSYVLREEGFIRFTVENDEGKIAEKPILSAVCG